MHGRDSIVCRNPWTAVILGGFKLLIGVYWFLFWSMEERLPGVGYGGPIIGRIMKHLCHPVCLTGLVAAAHTPFHEDGSLAPEVVPLQAAHYARNGVGVTFITGSTGEYASMTREERLRIYEAWAAAGPEHGVEVVAHVGGNCLEDAKFLAAAAAELGFRAFSALAPSYFRPQSLGMLVECCEEISSAACGMPFYYYHIPSKTGVDFDRAAFLRAASGRIPNLAGIKYTDGDLGEYEACCAVEDGRFDMLWGRDETLASALELGARGAVGSSYNFAAPLYHQIIDAHGSGDHDTARAMQEKSVWLIERLAGAGYFGASKALMGWLGVPVGPVRRPLVNPSPAVLAGLREELEGFEWFGDDGCLVRKQPLEI